MAPLKVLIIGGGIGGPALAFWLGKLGHNVTIIERFPELRAGGQQIDLRGQGVTAARRMGLLDIIRSKRVEELGIMIVDSKGTNKAFFGRNDTGKGRQAFSSEYEIMRGDLCQILYDTTLETGNVKWVFGTTVKTFVQGDASDAKSPDGSRVHVTFSDGREEDYDLVVGADGQSSGTRRQLLGLTEGQKDPTSSFLGVYACFYALPQDGTMDRIAKAYHAPAGVTATRVDNPKTHQVYHMMRSTHPLSGAFGSALAQRDVAAQKSVVAEIFRNSGWECEKLVDGMLHSKEAEDFYATEVASIVSPFWSKGRVALLGDAGYSSATFSGFGTSMALVAAYVLAGQIANNTTLPADGQDGAAESSGDVDLIKALHEYEDVLRPLATEAQRIPTWIWSVAIPNSAWGVWLLRFVVGMIGFLRIDKLTQHFGSDDKPGWVVPEYPKLDVLIRS